MFKEPRYIQNSFNVVFHRQPTIRRKANEFEDKLKGFYFQPQIFPIPDELDPEIPRIIFGSEHGYSQIIISQVSFVLNVIYSPDWQTDISKGREYLNERVSTLFDLLNLLEGTSAYFCGLSTKVRIASPATDIAILELIARGFFKNQDVQGIHDLQFKRTTIESGRFFSNITVNNYREWNIEGREQGIINLPTKEASERGIEIVGDFNDRCKFNEDKEYRSAIEVACIIIDVGLSEIGKFAGIIGGLNV